MPTPQENALKGLYNRPLPLAPSDIFAQLKRDEGFVPHIYVDTVGKHTIGYGHNLDANPLPWIHPGASITEAVASTILTDDVLRIETKLFASLPWCTGLDDARKGCLVNMAFNMGVPGLLAFKNTLAAVQKGDWATAGVGMTNSKWYTQVGQRAVRLVHQMETGLWS